MSGRDLEHPSRSVDDLGIVWFRRDLRLADNPAWSAASRRHSRVIAVFVLDETALAQSGAARRALLARHVHALDRDLRRLGGSLWVLPGPPRSAIRHAVERSGAAAVYLNEEVSPYGRRRDRQVFESLRDLSVPVHGSWGTLVHPPGSVLTKKSTLPLVFSAFARSWNETSMTEWPMPGDAEVVSTGETTSSAVLDRLGPRPEDEGPSEHSDWGSQGALSRLRTFDAIADQYAELRDIPALDATSGLSADLHFGTLSPREVLRAIGIGSAGRAAFSRQIIWRDWWAHLLHADPRLVTEPMDRRFAALEFDDHPAAFEAWTQGRTGVPLVDAGMRQLAGSGWMHNRVRMVTASYLVKHLHLDWRLGEAWFRRHLVDADVAQNVGNWQWVAGVGPDAAPYFRVFNPVAQGKKFDPDGAYIRRWVPELAGVAGTAIHDPWVCGDAELLGASGYPRPLVDLDEERVEALRRYKAAVSGTGPGPRGGGLRARPSEPGATSHPHDELPFDS